MANRSRRAIRPAQAAGEKWCQAVAFQIDIRRVGHIDMMSQPGMSGPTRVWGGNPDQHRLRKMPEETRPWRYREKTVNYLRKALADWQ